MLIKDLVVTGLVKLIRHATIRELVVEAVNQVTKEEIDTLKGVKSNIQEQLSTITNVVDTAKTEQTTWKSAIANAINRIKRNPNNEGLSDNSALSVFVSHIGNIEHGPDVSGVTATADDVMNGKKIVDSSGNIVTGTIVSIPSNTILKSAGTCILSSYYDGNQWVSCDKQTVLWLLLPINGYVYKNRPLCFPLSNFGGDTDATHVIKGKTFTSKSGYKITGTMPDRTGQSDMTNSPVYGYFEQGESSYINGYYGCRIPYGYYGQDFDDGTADVRIEAFAFNEKIGLSADKLKYGCTIGGVYGTFTHDMINRFDDNSGLPCEPITSNDVVFGKCGYVDGQAVRGHIQEATSVPGSPYDYRTNRQIVIAVNADTVYRKPSNSIYAYSSPYTAGPMARPYVGCSYSDMASLIGLTADKIVEGNTILGIEGTVSELPLNSIEKRILRNQQMICANNYYDRVIVADVPHSLTINTIATYIGYATYGMGTSARLISFIGPDGRDYTDQVSLSVVRHCSNSIYNLRTGWDSSIDIYSIRLTINGRLVEYGNYTITYTLNTYRYYSKSAAEDGDGTDEPFTCTHMVLFD